MSKKGWLLNFSIWLKFAIKGFKSLHGEFSNLIVSLLDDKFFEDQKYVSLPMSMAFKFILAWLIVKHKKIILLREPQHAHRTKTKLKIWLPLLAMIHYFLLYFLNASHNPPNWFSWLIITWDPQFVKQWSVEYRKSYMYKKYVLIELISLSKDVAFTFSLHTNWYHI